MYSILLVDDEKIELDMLRDYVDWKKAGIDKVYTARGSKSALACISENGPDIILTDIKMPGMSGTELAKLIREEGHPCKIIFLTGYEKFEYAKAAVQVQAEDYLLKPFQVEEVEQLVEKVLEKIKQERLAEEAEQLAIGQTIEQACTGRIDKVDSAFQRKAKEMSFCMLGICGTSAEQQQAIRIMPGVIHSFSLESLYIVLLRPSVSVQDAAKHFMNSWKQDIRIAACRNSVEFDKLQEQCGKLLQYQDDLFFGPPDLLLYAEDIGKTSRKISAGLHEPASKRDSLLLYAVLDGDEELAVQHLHTILKSFWPEGRDACRQSAYSLFIYLREHLKKNRKTPSSALQDKHTAQLLYSQTYIELEGIFTEYVRNCCRIYKEGAERQLVDWVMRYIADSYAGPCSAEEIADGLTSHQTMCGNGLRKLPGRQFWSI